MNLRELREEKHITQEQVSKWTAIPYGTYRRYEYGEEFPKKGALIALAKLYGMSPGQLLDLLLGWEDNSGGS